MLLAFPDSADVAEDCAFDEGTVKPAVVCGLENTQAFLKKIAVVLS